MKVAGPAVKGRPDPSGLVHGRTMDYLPNDRMPEAEVSLRLAFHLLDLECSDGAAVVAGGKS